MATFERADQPTASTALTVEELSTLHQACSTRTFEHMVDAAPVGMHELDVNGLITYVNRTECELLGYRREEMVGRPIWDFMAYEDTSTSRAAITRKLSGEVPLVPYVRTFIGTTRYVTAELRDTLVRSGHGEVVGIQSCLIDVTRQREADGVLREENHWVMAALQSLPEGVLVIDTLGAVRILNRAAERILGRAVEDVSGVDVQTCLSVADPLLATMNIPDFVDYLTSSHSREVMAIGGDGQLRTLCLRTAPLVDHTSLILGIVASIHEM